MPNTSQQCMQEADSSSFFLNESHLQSKTSTGVTIIDQLQQLTQRLIPDNSIQNNSDIQDITDTSEAASHINTHKLHDATNTLQLQPSPARLASPMIPVAESTPLKSPMPRKTTVDTSTSPMIKHYTTFSHSLSLSRNTPLSKEEEKLSTHLVRRKLHHDPDKQTIQCKTRGQPLVLTKTDAPRKHSTQVKTPTKRRRVGLVHGYRPFIVYSRTF